jgi:hypothetical protein
VASKLQDQVAQLERELAALRREGMGQPVRHGNPTNLRQGWWLAELAGDLEAGATASATLFMWNGTDWVSTGEQIVVRSFFLGSLSSGTRVYVRWYRNTFVVIPTGATAEQSEEECCICGTSDFEDDFNGGYKRQWHRVDAGFIIQGGYIINQETLPAMLMICRTKPQWWLAGMKLVVEVTVLEFNTSTNGLTDVRFGVRSSPGNITASGILTQLRISESNAFKYGIFTGTTGHAPSPAVTAVAGDRVRIEATLASVNTWNLKYFVNDVEIHAVTGFSFTWDESWYYGVATHDVTGTAKFDDFEYRVVYP